MNKHVTDEIAKLATDRDGRSNLIPLTLLRDAALRENTVEQYHACALEFQLEDSLLRERALNAASHLLTLCERARDTGLLKSGEFIDQYWHNPGSRVVQYQTSPFSSVVAALHDHCEILERKLIIWEHLTSRASSACNRARVEQVRPYLMKLWSGDRQREHISNQLERHDISAFVPMMPYSGAKYLSDIGQQPRAAAKIERLISRAYRLEALSERILRKTHPDTAESTINEWWQKRHQRLVSTESKAERTSRYTSLLEARGIALLNISHGGNTLAGSDLFPHQAPLSQSAQNVSRVAFDPAMLDGEAPSSLKKNALTSAIIDPAIAREQLLKLEPLIEERSSWLADSLKSLGEVRAAEKASTGPNALLLIRRQQLEAHVLRLESLESALKKRANCLTQLASCTNSDSTPQRSNGALASAQNQASKSLTAAEHIRDSVICEFQQWNSNYIDTIETLHADLRKVRAEEQSDASRGSRNMKSLFEKIQLLEEALEALEERGNHLFQTAAYLSEYSRSSRLSETTPQSLGEVAQQTLQELTPEEIVAGRFKLSGSRWFAAVDTSTRKVRSLNPTRISSHRAFPKALFYSPRITRGHHDIAKTVELLKSLSPYVQALQGCENLPYFASPDHSHALEVSSVQPNSTHDHTLIDLALSGLGLDEEHPLMGDKTASTTSSVVTKDLIAPDIATSGGSLYGTELIMKPIGAHATTICFTAPLSEEACKYTTRSSVIEVTVPHSDLKPTALYELALSLSARYAAYREVIHAIPLSHPFFGELTAHGQITRLENFRLEGVNGYGNGILSLKLGRGALLRDIVAEEPGTVLKLSGTSATFEGLELKDTILDASLIEGLWRNCSFSPRTVVRGALGRSFFDEQCQIHWDASSCDVSSIQIRGGHLTERCSGMLLKPQGFAQELIQRLQSRELSNAEFAQRRQEQNRNLGKWNFIKLVSALSDEIRHRPNDDSFSYNGRTSVAPTTSRYELLLPAPSQQFSLSLFVADYEDDEPCHLQLAPAQKNSKVKSGATSENIWDGRGVTYPQAILELMDYLERGSIQWSNYNHSIRPAGSQEGSKVFEIG